MLLSVVVVMADIKAIASGAFDRTDVEKIFVNVTDAEAIESICSTNLGLTSNDEHKDAVIYVPNSCYELYKSKLKYRKVMPQATDWQDEGIVVVNNATAGQLRLEMAMLDEDDVHLLKVTGKVNADDLSYLRSGQGRVAHLTLTFPARFDYIGSGVFDAKAKYTRFTSLNKNPKDISEYAAGDARQVPLYVPYGTAERYKARVGWKNFTNIVEMEPAAEPGDVNQDGAVDIADVVAVYNIMAGNSQSGFDGDVNNDGATDIADVVAIYNIMAGATN